LIFDPKRFSACSLLLPSRKKLARESRVRDKAPVIHLTCVVLLSGALLFAGVVLAQDDGEGTPAPAFECGPMAGTAHECHCANMVEAFQARYQEDCRKNSRNKAELEACMNNRPATCDVMDFPGRYGMSGHPNQCLNKCAKTHCTCNEGACARPPQQVAPVKRGHLPPPGRPRKK